MGWGVPDKYKPKGKRGRGRVSPTGPYPAESGSKSIREKQSPAEREKFHHGQTNTALRARKLARKEHRERASAERQAASAKAGTRPTETLKRAEAKLARNPGNSKLHEATKRLRHALASEAAFKAGRKTPEGSPVKANFPEPELKDVAPRAYRKTLREAQTGGHGSSKGLGEPEDLTTAITLAAPGGGLVGAVGKRAVEVGGKAAAKEIADAAAAKIEAKGSKTIAKGLNAGSGVRAAGRLAGRGAGRVAGRDTAKLAEAGAKASATRAARRKAAQAAAARSRSASAAVPGLKLGKIGIAGTPAARGHIEALADNPWKTTKTTARALPGLVTVPLGMVGNAGLTAGRAASEVAHEAHVPGAAGYSGKEILAPVAHIPGEQLAFAKQVAKVLTATDSKMVKKEVEDNLGLMLPIMLGLGSKAVADKFSKGRVTEAVRKLAERSRERHGKAHGYVEGKAPKVLERTSQRKGAARAVAKGRTRLKGELHARQQPMLEAARGATRSEVVRKDVVAGKRGKKHDLVIHDADVASFLQRHPMPDDPVAQLAEVKRIQGRMKPLPKGVKLDPAKIYSREVIDHILKHPDVLANPSVQAVVRHYREQGAIARQDKALAPEHSERARFLPAATTRDIPFPEEMHPRSVRDITRAEPTRGKLSKDVLRKEARRDRSRGRALRKKADTVGKKASIMRERLRIYERQNKGRLELENLPLSHERLRGRIDKLDAQAVNLREKADQADQMAIAKHKAASEVDLSLAPEFADKVKAQLRREGIPDEQFPEYQHAGTGRDHTAPTYGSSGSKLTEFPGKSKMRKGFAEEHGMVEEGLRPMIRESIARPVARRESYKAARQVIEANQFAPGGKKEWSAKEANELFGGADPALSSDQWMKVPRQFYKRIYDVLEGKGKGKGISAQDFELVGNLEAMRKGKGAAGSHYLIVRKAAMDELVDQLSNSLVSPKIAQVNRATSYLILGTSPAWAAMQVVAEYSQAAVAQPKLLNPAFVKKALDAYKNMDPTKRHDFDSWVGVTARSIEKAEDLKLDLQAGDMQSAHNAYTTLESTPYGRFLRGIPTAIQRVDQWKGGRIRALTALAKIDKDLNSRTNHFIRGIGGMHREMGTALEAMKGKSLKEQAEWVANHPKWAHHYQSYLDDVMGNWSALTRNERVAAQAMIFYPFVRMSLRWTFYAFPKRHPIRAAILYGLAQQNAQEVKKLLGGDPSYFGQWASVPINPEEGRKGGFFDLSRIAPGSNALVEALGGSTEGPKGIAAAKLSQPAIAALATTIYGVSPLSGKQEPGSGWSALAQLLSLSPLARTAGELTLPSGRKKTDGVGQLPIIGSFSTERQEALDKLSAKLRGAGTVERYARTLIAPPLPKNVGKEADSALLGRVLKAFEKNSSSARDDVSSAYATKMKNAVEEGKRHLLPGMKKERETRLGAMEAEYTEADKKLNGLFDRYSIPYKKEDRLFLQYYGEGKYRDPNAEDNPWAGSADVGGANPWSQKSTSAGSNPWGN